MCVARGLWTWVVCSVWERIFNTERYGRTKHKLHTKQKAARGWTSLQNRVPAALYTFFSVLKQLLLLNVAAQGEFVVMKGRIGSVPAAVLLVVHAAVAGNGTQVFQSSERETILFTTKSGSGMSPPQMYRNKSVDRPRRLSLSHFIQQYHILQCNFMGQSTLFSTNTSKFPVEVFLNK